MLNNFFGFFFKQNIFLDVPKDYQFGFQDSATSVMEGLIDLHHSIMFFLILIIIFVFWLIFMIFVDFSDLDRNRYYNNIRNSVVMKNQTHGVMIEVIWTIIPTVIVIFIAVPSFALLYSMEDVLGYFDTVKVTGHQWYWTYEFTFECDESNNVYRLMEQQNLNNFNKLVDSFDFESGFGFNTPDSSNNNYIFESNLLTDNDRKFMHIDKFSDNVNSDIIKYKLVNYPYYFRLLETDRFLIIPLRYSIRLLITASDVLHAFAVPSFGIKVDAVPGRINSVVLHVKRPGVFFGQCSELCGVNHGFMPIEVLVPHYNDNLLFEYNNLVK